MRKEIINLEGINAVIERMQKDINRLEEKAEFYGNIWEKCQQLENAFDDDTPTEYINHVYSIWAIASDREQKVQYLIKELKTQITILKRTVPTISELYEYMLND